MKKLILLISILMMSSLVAQSQFQQFINYVNSLGDPAAKQAAVDSFMTYTRSQGIPFIEDSTANFIYLGNPNSITVPGDFNGWNTTSWPMTNLIQTNFWYRSENFELDARLDYKFILDGSNWILDPENPNICTGGYGPNSELSMPLYIQPWEINYNPNIEHGIIIQETIFSINVNANYQLNIYLPPGYDSLSAITYPTVYFQDGGEYISLASTANVLDNLLDSSKIGHVIAVFVTPNNRNEEYAGSLRNQYRLFFVNELVPYIDANYMTKDDPKERLVIGPSYGANISALISYNHPEVFGLCGLHSGAFQSNNYEAYNLIINGPVKDIKWSSIWGSYEGNIAQTMGALRDFLIGSSYEIDWLERPEGHSWGLWRATVDRILEYFFPGNPSNIFTEKDKSPERFMIYQNYPNPFNPLTVISYQLPVGSNIILKVYDVLGNEVATLVDEYKPAGSYEFEFNSHSGEGRKLTSGIYFYQLKTENFIETRKMILMK